MLENSDNFSQEELDQLEQNRNAAVLALETVHAKSALKLLESAHGGPITESWGQYVDPLGWLYEDSNYAQTVGPIPLASGFNQGLSQHVLANEQSLEFARNAGRALAASSATAIGILKNLTNYCMGTGFTYKVLARQDTTPDSNVPQGLIGAVQHVVDNFLEENDWCGNFERELFTRSRRDGEYFLALFPRPMGNISVRVIEPEQVTEPQNSKAVERDLGISFSSSWSFGVHTSPNDVQSIHGYHIAWDAEGKDWDYFPIHRIEHLKLNVDRNIKRGISDFCSVQAELEGVDKLLRNIREGAAVQAAIAFIREHLPSTTSGQIHSLSNLTKLGGNSSSGPKRRGVSKYEPGTILDVSHGMQYKPGPLGASHGPNFIAIQQAVLRSIGTRWCMPEYMVSGDASNSNYASSIVAESPFVKFCQAEQRFYANHFRRVLWKVIALAHEMGQFENWHVDLATLQDMMSLHVNVPSVVVRDSLAETQVREIEHRNGILSKKTWAAETGREYESEQLNQRSESVQN